MDTILTITLTSIVIGFFYRGKKLLNLIKGAHLSASLSKDRTLTDIQATNASAGCIGCICFPFFAVAFVLPIYLFFRLEWWIPIVAIIVGLTLGNLLGYLVERILNLPNHQTFDGSLFNDNLLNLNAIELSTNEKLYKRAFRLLLFYNIMSLIMALAVIIQNEIM